MSGLGGARRTGMLLAPRIAVADPIRVTFEAIVVGVQADSGPAGAVPELSPGSIGATVSGFLLHPRVVEFDGPVGEGEFGFRIGDGENEALQPQTPLFESAVFRARGGPCWTAEFSRFQNGSWP